MRPRGIGGSWRSRGAWGHERRGVDDLGKMSKRSRAGLRKGGSRRALAGRGRCRGQGRNRSVAGTQAGQRVAALPGLGEGVIPIQRISTRTQIRIGGKSWTVTCTQFPITGAYSFTNYCAQGQTIPYVIIDITSPPTSGLSLFNLYVALSHSSGRDMIRLLRDFDDGMFLQAHVPELLEEDEQLGGLDLITRRWWDKMSLTV